MMTRRWRWTLIRTKGVQKSRRESWKGHRWHITRRENDTRKRYNKVPATQGSIGPVMLARKVDDISRMSVSARQCA